MGKVTGQDLEFWFEGVEIPVQEVNTNVAFDQLDSTDTATPGDGKDSEVGRAARSFTVSGLLYTPNGAEVATGTLTKGNRYRVTAKDTELADYEIGQIFESDGTEEMSATDKVVPLGSKITGENMSFSFNGTAYPVTSVDYSASFDQLDVTDTETTGDGKETILSRADRDTSVNMIMREDAAELLTVDPAKVAGIVLFTDDNKAEGFILPVSKNPVDNTLDVVKIAYAFKWIGVPTETNLGLALNSAQDFRIIYKRGATTNKEKSGTAIITSKTISCDISGLATITYTVQVNGALTETEADAESA